MRPNTLKYFQYLHKTIGENELRALFDIYAGDRITVPTWKIYSASLHTERDDAILRAYAAKEPGSVQEFCRQQARKQGCSAKTIRRTLNKVFKKAA